MQVALKHMKRCSVLLKKTCKILKPRCHTISLPIRWQKLKSLMHSEATGKRHYSNIAGGNVNCYNPHKGQFGNKYITNSPFNPAIPLLEPSP